MMKKAQIFVGGHFAGILEALADGKYRFTYTEGYQDAPVSLTMPIKQSVYTYDQFPPFFEGLLPEGVMLQALLRKYKLDQYDYLSQLITVGNDLVGAVTVKELS